MTDLNTKKLQVLKGFYEGYKNTLELMASQDNSNFKNKVIEYSDDNKNINSGNLPSLDSVEEIGINYFTDEPSIIERISMYVGVLYGCMKEPKAFRENIKLFSNYKEMIKTGKIL